MNPQKSKSILMPTFRSISLVDTDEITYLQAMQNYCRLYKYDGTHILTSLSFGKTIELLEPYGFYQCHKSYALKLDTVLKYFKEGKVEIEGNVMIPVARRRRNGFLKVMNGGVD